MTEWFVDDDEDHGSDPPRSCPRCGAIWSGSDQQIVRAHVASLASLLLPETRAALIAERDKVRPGFRP